MYKKLNHTYKKSMCKVLNENNKRRKTSTILTHRASEGSFTSKSALCLSLGGSQGQR